MKIAITGATGFIGKEVVTEALSKGHQVVAITRATGNTETIDKPQLTFAHADLTHTSTLTKHLEGCDLVIHLAASMSGADQLQQTLDSTRSLLTAMDKSSVKRLVLLSSISVIDYSQNKPLSTINEETPLCTNDIDLGTYAQMKRDQEQMCTQWKAAGKELLIIRPGLVYSNNNFSDAHAGFIQKGFGIVATHKGTVPLIDIKQVARQTIIAATNTLLTNEVFHLVGKPPQSQKDYLQQLKEHGQIRFSLPLPWMLYSKLAEFIRCTLTLIKKQHKIPDSFKKNSVAARQKPFRFSSKKADDLLM